MTRSIAVRDTTAHQLRWCVAGLLRSQPAGGHATAERVPGLEAGCPNNRTGRPLPVAAEGRGRDSITLPLLSAQPDLAKPAHTLRREGGPACGPCNTAPSWCADVPVRNLGLSRRRGRTHAKAGSLRRKRAEAVRGRPRPQLGAYATAWSETHAKPEVSDVSGSRWCAATLVVVVPIQDVDPRLDVIRQRHEVTVARGAEPRFRTYANHLLAVGRTAKDARRVSN